MAIITRITEKGIIQEFSEDATASLRIEVTATDSAGAIITGGGGGGGDTTAQYLVLATSPTLTNERVFSVSTGLSSSDLGAGGFFRISIDDSVVATISGSTFTGVTKHNLGLSGSLTSLVDGTSYLVAGPNISIVTQSNGSILITGSAAGGGATTPGGGQNEIQFNNANAFTGSSKLTFDGTALRITGSMIQGNSGLIRGSNSTSLGAATAGLNYFFSDVSGLNDGINNGVIVLDNNSPQDGDLSSSFVVGNAIYIRIPDSNYWNDGTNLITDVSFDPISGKTTITTDSTLTNSNIVYIADTTKTEEQAAGAKTESAFAIGGGTAIGSYAYAQGSSVAVGDYSHAEGAGIAIGDSSHAEGLSTTAVGSYSHAEGNFTFALGENSHAGGLGTIASGSSQTACGVYNKRSNDFSLFVVGNGTDDPDADRSDILRVNQSTVEVTGSFILSGSFNSPIGTDCTFGSVTLSSGEVVVSNTNAGSDSVIFLTKQTFATPAGVVGVSAKSAGTFTITSSEAADADTVGYFIVNPA